MPFDCLIPPTAVPVESSLLANVFYDDTRAILEVELRDGARYQYADVPLQIFQDLLRADSKGAYFNGHIRGIFPTRKLHRAPAPPPAGSVP